ncbi:MAG: hypothetical protein H0T46_33225 [Deltaproteobacteria bacterium]|nr:hypothetical protein [Deltaproteobacteria bacterium]
MALWTVAARAETIVYLSRDGVDLRPGRNNSHAGTSSLIEEPATIGPWETTPEVWAETVACVREVYAPFAVTITEEEPGNVPYIQAVFGGSPLDLDMPRSYAGISPFRGDCSVIERSIVFAFTDILPPDAQTVCHTIAQEIGHSFGLDHVLMDSDPMSTAHKPGKRAFVDQDAACGEGKPRKCGLPSSPCSTTQNSYALLAERIGLAGDELSLRAVDQQPDEVGCAAAGGSGGGALLVLAVVAPITRRPRANRIPRKNP